LRVDLLRLFPTGGVKLGYTGTLKTPIVLGIGRTLSAPIFRIAAILANPVFNAPRLRNPLFPNPTFPNPKLKRPRLPKPKLQPETMCMENNRSKRAYVQSINKPVYHNYYIKKLFFKRNLNGFLPIVGVLFEISTSFCSVLYENIADNQHS